MASPLGSATHESECHESECLSLAMVLRATLAANLQREPWLPRWKPSLNPIGFCDLVFLK